MIRNLLIFTALIHTTFGETPRETLDAWLKACKVGNFDKAWALEAKNLELPPNLQEEERKIAKANFDRNGGEVSLEVLAEKVEGDCAAFAVNESKKDGRPAFDLDPIYLLKQEGGWKILPNPGQLKYVAPEKVEAFAKLEAWFKAFKQDATSKRKTSK
jgi:hypothetical protein